MEELLQRIDGLLEAIAPKADVKESLEWYLRNNLLDYKRVLQSEPSNKELDDATRVLVRFCAESMDWDNPLYRECTSITAEGARLSKHR